ncbi:MAG: hypothetical protein K0R20_246 [Actinomycetia bacterium]|jgi:hypothetical protein|nr:hypothetical protein [Actinomycetes bacterium]
MRRSRGPHLALSLLSILSAIVWIAAPAHAQGEPDATIRLIRQTAYTTPEQPVIRLAIRISNVRATIPDAVIGWRLGPKVVSRVGYETALKVGPPYAAAADTVFDPGDIKPGETIDIAIKIDTSETGAIEDDSGVYPLQIELRSGDELTTSMTTAVIHIFQPPEKRVWFSWWTEVATPIAFGPDGTLIDLGFESTLESGGGIVAQVEALRDLLQGAPASAAVDLIVSPVALDQLERAADGYRRADGTTVPSSDPAPLAAAATLERLREIAASPLARLHAMPFAAPRLPALLSAGLKSHLDAHWRVGDETFERILGERPDPAVARPPGLAFDQASVDSMEARGVTTLLGAVDTVARPPQDNDFAPPPAATLHTSSGGDVTLLLPDPGATSLLNDPVIREDPILAAHVLLGELATIWKERPVPPDDVERGLALDLAPDLPAAFWLPAVRRLSQAPFLEPAHAGDLRGHVLPPPEPATLGSEPAEAFLSSYTTDLVAAAQRVNTFGRVVEEPAGEADRLRRGLLYAEASQYIRNEGSGRIWINWVNDVIDSTFDAIAPDTARPLTFTSRSGTIPLRMGDPGSRVLTVRVELASVRVDFLGTGSRPVRITEPNQVITFDAEVRAAGTSRVEVFVRSPDGVELSRAVLVVRSTAINPIALAITIGAGLVLVALWSRRLFRRRQT